MKINYNGSIENQIDSQGLNRNRAFSFGDGLFDTLKVDSGRIQYPEDHYFRLMSSIRMLRMKIPGQFTLEGYESEIMRTARVNGLESGARVRVSVYRATGGLYTPESNQSDFIIEASALPAFDNSDYEIELFKDFHVFSGLLSTIKTNNRMINVLASIFAQENDYQGAVLINEKKELVGASNANMFLVRDRKLITPPLSSGCINGIMRNKVIEAVGRSGTMEIDQSAVSPFELLKADEVFLTNSIEGIRPVTRYRKKEYRTEIAKEIADFLKSMQ